jgi:L-rhamnose isomerase
MADTTILTEVKSRLTQLGYTATDSDDNALNYLIAKVLEEIYAACNISEMPADNSLKYVEIDMICGEFLQQKKLMGTIDGFDFSQGLKALTEGDVSMTFSDAETTEIKFDRMVNWLLTHGQEQLIAARRMKW